jgi:hypothetical protein
MVSLVIAWRVLLIVFPQFRCSIICLSDRRYLITEQSIENYEGKNTPRFGGSEILTGIRRCFNVDLIGTMSIHVNQSYALKDAAWVWFLQFMGGKPQRPALEA